MAITFDQYLGNIDHNLGTTTSFTTTAAAASGSRVVVCVAWWNSLGAAMTVTIGGTTATIDKQLDSGNEHFVVASLVVAGGLSSGSTIQTVQTTGAGQGGQMIGACSYLGTTAVDTTATSTGTGSSFSSGSATNALADSLFVGGASNECTTTSIGGTNTNGTMRYDVYHAADLQGSRMLDLIVSSIGAQALTGTWANASSTANNGVLVIYKGTVAGIPDVIQAPLQR